jgi:UDP-N-acetylglucosamine:LPS N-acetylglucosamine transferase
LMVKDVEALEKLVPEMMKLVNDDSQQISLSKNLLKLAKHDAAEKIAEYILSLPKRTA